MDKYAMLILRLVCISFGLQIFIRRLSHDLPLMML